MQMFLERTGYAVTCCPDGKSALATVAGRSAEFRLLIADLSLPDMEGHEMALQILDYCPDIRVLLCSGYPFDVESLPEAVRSRFATLQKPFVPQMLTRAVEELLTR